MRLRNCETEVSYDRPDPILVAQRYKEPYSALACALFAYGRADLIVRFLDTLDFSLIDATEDRIKQAFSTHYYRFQNTEDISQFFVTLHRMKQAYDIEELFTRAYEPNRSVLEGMNAVITAMKTLNNYDSRGYCFLIGSPVRRFKGGAPMKRWMMFLRWMVRADVIDFGLWSGVNRADLLIPLDTHTFTVSKRLGLLERKAYDMQSVIDLTLRLRTFDPDDPVKYDFALYRIGQERQMILM